MLSLTEKIIIYALHVIGLFFAYGAAGIVLYLLCEMELPRFTFLETMAYSVGVLIGLPFVAIACLIVAGKKDVFNRVMAGLYLLLWFGVIIKIVFFTS